MAEGSSSTDSNSDQIPSNDTIHNQNYTNKGFFVEAGASDGEIISNSLYFEIKYKWTGLLVEPNPDFHDALFAKRRDAWILPHCLSTNSTPIIVDFFADLIMSGIIDKDTIAIPPGMNSSSHGETMR